MKVNQNGQVVIPKELREKYGIEPGQEMVFREQAGKLILEKKGVREQLRNALDTFDFEMPEGIETTDEFLEKARGS